MKKSVFPFFIHNTIDGFLDKIHRVTSQGKLQVQITFFVFIFMTVNIFDLNRVQTVGPKWLKRPFSGCYFIPFSMNLFSFKWRHNNLIVKITQISNLSEYTSPHGVHPTPALINISQHDSKQSKLIFSMLLCIFFRRVPSYHGNNSIAFIIDSKF